MAAAHVIRGDTVSAVPQAQLDPSAVIGEAFNTYKQHAGVLIPAALGVYAIQAIAAIALSSNTLGALLLNIISLVLAMIYTGAVVQCRTASSTAPRGSSSARSSRCSCPCSSSP